MGIANAQPACVRGDKVWCPACSDYVQIVRVTSAARIIDVDRRTVYNYIKTKKVYAIRIAGCTLRVCSSCLLRENDDRPVGDNKIVRENEILEDVRR